MTKRRFSGLIPGIGLVTFCSGSLFAQSSLLLSSAALPGTPVAMNLSLSSPPQSEPAALEWTFAYPAGIVASLVVTPGGSLSRANKSLTCGAVTGGYACIAAGGSATIANGV